jgi:hypothetical protein
MEYTYTLTIDEQKRIFLFGYYNRPIVWFQRRFAGPVLIVLGGTLILLTHHIESIIIALFFIWYGIYMILRPFLLLRRIKFSDTCGRIVIENTMIRIINEKGELKIEQNEVLDIVKKKHYLLVKVHVHVVQYYVLDLHSFTSGAGMLFEELSNMKNK